jgi:hypothetical protein
VVVGVCLGLLLLTAALAGLASTDRGLRVGGERLPSLCLLRNTTGLPCPGCGLTRSWVDLARGDLRASLAHHRLGWLVMLYVALQAARHGAWLAAPGWRPRLDRFGGWLDRSLIVLAGALLVNWVATLAALWRSA